VFGDDPIIILPLNEVVEKKAETEEEIFEEKYCHGEAIGKVRDDEEMLDGDYSLKANLERHEGKPGKKQFQEIRKKIGEFFKSNIETIL
jgi:hypothetical protein